MSSRRLREKLDLAISAQQVIMDRLMAMRDGSEAMTIQGLRQLLVQVCDAAVAVKAVYLAYQNGPEK